jgi:hypothetical protein
MLLVILFFRILEVWVVRVVQVEIPLLLLLVEMVGVVVEEEAVVHQRME